ncbi:hypothetical protein PPERSA_11414 [Pseudocohnilembus persalinus]|uniref:C3H1-type domain-containing protein n=1 Tax=Pseudocohnilembus persalinus TaxID=266149 RepID=A0A0V0QPU4_PSEPJ|nr:hypothetical protein PPERSA_11414 [Pseudocohnilembus persalinus]|eukprot:KRX04290.1 hypothetical protein PPERSA_11414 [Pseudocohnilembus persalinus]
MSENSDSSQDFDDANSQQEQLVQIKKESFIEEQMKDIEEYDEEDGEDITYLDFNQFVGQNKQTPCKRGKFCKFLPDKCAFSHPYQHKTICKYGGNCWKKQTSCEFFHPKSDVQKNYEKMEKNHPHFCIDELMQYQYNVNKKKSRRNRSQSNSSSDSDEKNPKKFQKLKPMTWQKSNEYILSPGQLIEDFGFIQDQIDNLIQLLNNQASDDNYRSDDTKDGAKIKNGTKQIDFLDQTPIPLSKHVYGILQKSKENYLVCDQPKGQQYFLIVLENGQGNYFNKF